MTIRVTLGGKLAAVLMELDGYDFRRACDAVDALRNSDAELAALLNSPYAPEDDQSELAVLVLRAKSQTV